MKNKKQASQTAKDDSKGFPSQNQEASESQRKTATINTAAEQVLNTTFKSSNDKDQEPTHDLSAFQKYEKNETLPIHNNFDDSEADKDSLKPGGIFTKKLYADQNKMGINSDDDLSDEEKSKEENQDSQAFGFCRTNSIYRAHYKLARLKDQIRFRKQTSESQTINEYSQNKSYLNSKKSETSRYSHDQSKDEDYQQKLPQIKKAKLIRMQQLKLSDYYSAEDEAANKIAFAKYMDNKEATQQYLDGVMMIKMFVEPNRMTQWNLTNRIKKLRENCVKQSYIKLKKMKEKGLLDHIKIPLSPFQQAIERKTLQKFQFSQILSSHQQSIINENSVFNQKIGQDDWKNRVIKNNQQALKKTILSKQNRQSNENSKFSDEMESQIDQKNVSQMHEELAQMHEMGRTIHLVSLEEEQRELYEQSVAQQNQQNQNSQRSKVDNTLRVESKNNYNINNQQPSINNDYTLRGESQDRETVLIDQKEKNQYATLVQTPQPQFQILNKPQSIDSFGPKSISISHHKRNNNTLTNFNQNQYPAFFEKDYTRLYDIKNKISKATKSRESNRMNNNQINDSLQNEKPKNFVHVQDGQEDAQSKKIEQFDNSFQSKKAQASNIRSGKQALQLSFETKFSKQQETSKFSILPKNKNLNSFQKNIQSAIKCSDQSETQRLKEKEWTQEEIMDEIKNDLSLGMDSLYRVKLKEQEKSFRIVAPFIQYALNPPKMFNTQDDKWAQNEVYSSESKKRNQIEIKENQKQKSIISNKLHIHEQSSQKKNELQQIIIDKNGEELVSNSELTTNIYHGQKANILNPISQITSHNISKISQKNSNKNTSLENDDDINNTQYLYDNEEDRDSNPKQNRNQKLQSITSNQYDVQERKNLNQSQINSPVDHNINTIQNSKYTKNTDTLLDQFENKSDFKITGKYQTSQLKQEKENENIQINESISKDEKSPKIKNQKQNIQNSFENTSGSMTSENNSVHHRVKSIEKIVNNDQNLSYINDRSYFQESGQQREKFLTISQVPMSLSTKEEEIKRKEKAILFQKFLRPHEARIVPKDNPQLIYALLHQPKPFKLKQGNLLETFGCKPGPGIRENAKFILKNTLDM